MATLSNSWSLQTLDNNFNPAGAPQTLAALGIESATFDLNNLAADVLTFTVGGAAIDAATLWPYGTSLILLKPDGSRFFFGRVEPWTRDGSPDAQNHLGRLVNPWWYLAKLIYQQVFQIPASFNSDGSPNYKTYTTPRVILNIGYNPTPAAGSPYWVRWNTGQQIRDALQWAIGKGAPLAIGTLDPDTTPATDFQKGITCEEALKKMFRLEPDFAVDWDYTTTPFPTIHFRKQKSFVPLTIDLSDTTLREQITIRERPDWQRSYVNINYDQTDTIGNAQYLAIANDLYPDPMPTTKDTAFSGVDLFVDLNGFRVATSSQTAQFASIPADWNNIDTWKNWRPELQETDIKTVILSAGKPVTLSPQNENSAPLDTTCIYELVDGTWCDWIPNVRAQKIRLRAYVDITKNSGAAEKEKPISYDATMISFNTNGILQEFTQVTASLDDQNEETPPVGLAKQMWTSWQNLAIEGSFENVEAVIGATQPISRKNCLNFLSVKQPQWANVNAVIQGISGDIGKGISKIKFGAPLHLTGNELIDAVRATRYRAGVPDLAFLFGGVLSNGGGNVRLSRKTHAHSTSHGSGAKQVDVVSQTSAPQAGKDPVIVNDGTTGATSWSPPNGPVQPPVKLDPAGARGSDGNWHPVTLKEMKVCVKNADGSNTQRTMICLCSNVYQGVGDPN